MHSPEKVSKIRILLCDDHAMVREGTRRILEAEQDMEVIGEASDGAEAVELCRRLSPDVVALDVSMPQMNGVEATKLIRATCPTAKILVLTAYDDFAYVTALLQNGAAGYVLKSARAEQLIQAIRAVAVGESVVDPAVMKQVVARLSRREAEFSSKVDEPHLTANLTEKELQVLRLAAAGLSNKEIASKLSVSHRTVQAHLASIFGKMQVSSRTEAVILALKQGLISSRDIEVEDR